MRSKAIIVITVLACAATLISPSSQASDCKTKRESALKLVQQQEKNQSLNLAIVVPNCNEDGTYATFQCHHGSNFCQCWDKEGYPLTQPKKNLNQCRCLVDRAKDMKSIPPSQTGNLEITSCEVDGSYTAKQCNPTGCWCVNPETGAKLTTEIGAKNKVKC